MPLNIFVEMVADVFEITHLEKSVDSLYNIRQTIETE